MAVGIGVAVGNGCEGERASVKYVVSFFRVGQVWRAGQ